MRRFFTSAVCGLMAWALAANAWGQITVDFEDLTVPPAGYYNGSDGGTSWTSQGATFNVAFTDFGGGFTYWEGFSYSNQTDVTTAGFLNQYSAYVLPDGGGSGSTNYAMASVGTTQIDLPSGTTPVSMQVTNATYAALSMRDGDPFAKQFGGASGNDPDWFLLTITGFDALDQAVGSPVEFYLADFRSSNNAEDYIVDSWTTVDLSSLTGAERLSFSLSSSDVGDFGMNTPATFALDNLIYATAVPEPSTLALLSALGLLAWRRRRRTKDGRYQRG